MYSQRFRLQQRLKSSYMRKATKLGLGLSPACISQLDKLVHNGVERMDKQGVLEREDQIWSAEQMLGRYMTKLSEKAQKMGTFPKVDDIAFDKTMKEQCPMWPYC